MTPCACGGSPLFQGGEKFVGLQGVLSPLQNGDGREAAGVAFETIFCAKPVEPGFAHKIDCVAPLGLSAENCRNPGLAPWATVYRSLRELIQPRSGVTS